MDKMLGGDITLWNVLETAGTFAELKYGVPVKMPTRIAKRFFGGDDSKGGRKARI